MINATRKRIRTYVCHNSKIKVFFRTTKNEGVATESLKYAERGRETEADCFSLLVRRKA